MNKFCVFLLTVVCISVLGCGRSGDVQSIVTDLDSLTSEITKKISTNDVAGAKAAMDSKKAGLKAQFEALKKIPEDKIPKDQQDKLLASIQKNLKALDTEIGIQSSRNSAATEPAERVKALADNAMMEKLRQDFLDIIS
jgi:hypothetical protein